MLAPLLLTLALGLQDKPQQLPEVQMSQAQFVILVAPETLPPAPENEAEVQKEHLEFLQGLWESGKALLVGPMADAGRQRGIVVLDVPDAESAKKIMADDPWVKRGALQLETRTWFFAKNYLRKGADFLDLGTYWIGFLERPKDAPTVSKEESQKIQDGHMANITKMAKEGALLLAGPFVEDTSLRGIFIFKEMPKAEVESLVAEDPAIKAHRLEMRLVPLYASKGTFIAEKPSSEDEFKRILKQVALDQEAGKFKEVVDGLEKAIELMPGSEIQLGLVRYETMARLGDDRTIAYAKHLAEVYKDEAVGLNNLAWFMVDDEVNFKKPDLKLAVSLAEKAVALSKEQEATYLDTLAYCYFKSGKVDKAISTQEKAVKLLDKADMDDATKEELRDRLSKFKKAKKGT
ncbi:MAG: hypothetical protein JSS66_17925 [Armatimonadetes bacterium]|nr:hypothetical protein [Armatimonadota bacterium]